MDQIPESGLISTIPENQLPIAIDVNNIVDILDVFLSQTGILYWRINTCINLPADLKYD